jgi:60 kDa SS-A/Ro ribonucleoprotein
MGKWTLRDALRLSHPKGVDVEVGNFILGKYEAPVAPNREIATIEGFRVMQSSQTSQAVINTLTVFPNLPWETIPTQFLKDKDVWAKLLTNNQLNGQALVRSVTRLAKIGAFDDMKFARAYADKLTDSAMVEKTRLHPIQYLLALTTYTEGQLKRNGDGYYSMWGSPREKSWTVNSVIADALNDGFYKSFKTIVPADKRTMIALDVSGSMGADANGIDLSCAQVAAAMAMIVARTEPLHQIMGFSTKLVEIGISPSMRLDDVINKIARVNMGGTDLAKPMLYAAEKGIEVDTFAIFTDNETWAGRVHPYEALKAYRKKMGIDAKLAVFGVSSTEFTIADPKDSGTMDFVGFDSNAASVFADFSAGRL